MYDEYNNNMNNNSASGSNAGQGSDDNYNYEGSSDTDKTSGYESSSVSYEPNFTTDESREDASSGSNPYGNTSYGQDTYGRGNSRGRDASDQDSYSTEPDKSYEQGYYRQNIYEGARYERTSYEEAKEEPRWEPNPGKYNTYTADYTQAPPKKKKRKWWLIPLIVVLAVMVAFIAYGVYYGFTYIESLVSSDTDSDSTSTDDSTELNIVDSSDASSSGIVLTDVSSVVEEVMPAVVSITSRTLVNNYSNFWGYSFGGSSESSSEEVESGIGSGTIVGTNDTELLILTSYHVVEDSSSLYVTFCDDESVDGYIKSVSEEYDIAVVAVPLDDISDSTLESITIATICTEQASVGEGVIVIGDALGYGQSVTTGIVSAVDREITVENRTISVIQTDAAINSGNSGGCVLNSAGQIIGISEAKITSDTVEGMCYAISVNVYADLIEELLTTTTTSSGSDSDDEEETTSGSGSSASSSSQTAYLGIRGVDVDSDTASSYNMVEGVYVASVVSGGGAEAAGVEEGDIIVGLDGTSLTTMTELQSLLAEYSAGDTVTLTVMRSSGSGYTEIDLEVTLTSQIN